MTSATDPVDLPRGVGMTAIGVAYVRAAETARAGRLFADPYAESFVTAAPEALSHDQATGVTATLGARFAFQAVIRTRFFDDYLLTACAAGYHQIVILAAGLDTRAFRLPWPPGGCRP